MSQSDGTNTLTRIEFSYSKADYKFNINPQNIRVVQPHRVSVLKTQSAYVVDDFNDDVQSVIISGTAAGPRLKGEQAIMNLWNFLDGYSNQVPSYGQAPREPLTFYNHTDNYAFATVIGPEGYTIERDVSRPLEWNYEINLIVLGYVGLIAEDLVKADLEEFVVRDVDTGSVESIRYDRIGIALIPAVRQQRDMINELRLEIERLKDKVQ